MSEVPESEPPESRVRVLRSEESGNEESRSLLIDSTYENCRCSAGHQLKAQRQRAPELENELREKLQDARVARLLERQRAHVPCAHMQRLAWRRTRAGARSGTARAARVRLKAVQQQSRTRA